MSYCCQAVFRKRFGFILATLQPVIGGALLLDPEGLFSFATACFGHAAMSKPYCSPPAIAEFHTGDGSQIPCSAGSSVPRVACTQERSPHKWRRQVQIKESAREHRCTHFDGKPDCHISIPTPALKHRAVRQLTQALQLLGLSGPGRDAGKVTDIASARIDVARVLQTPGTQLD